MSETSSALLDSQLRSKKRRYSALELLTISPPRPEDAKRPRILEVDDDDRSAAAASTPSGSSPNSPVTAAEDLADAPRSSSVSDTDISPTNKLFVATGPRPDQSAERIDWQPSLPDGESQFGVVTFDQEGDADADDDYTSSSGSDDASTSSSSSSSDSGSRAPYGDDDDYDDDELVVSPFDGAHFSRAPATPSPLATDYADFVPRDSPPPRRRPPARFVTPQPSSSDLRERLRAFIPALAADNADLEAAHDLAARSMEVDVPSATIHVTPPSDTEGEDDEFVDAHDGSQVIEMDLGLGVLEERRPGDESCSSSSSSASSEDGDDERDLMGRLMGRRRSRPDIEVISDASRL